MMFLLLIFFAILFLAYANGANDNFKGVATLFGSKTTNFKRSLLWTTVTTFSGSIVSIFLAQMLVETFTGKGLVPDSIIDSHPFILSVGLGAALAVMIASLLGIPISTTHSLTGALFGAGLIASGSHVNYAALGQKFFLPLLLSPLLAILFTMTIYPLFRFVRVKLGITRDLNGLHFLSAGLVSFSRGLNDTPKIAALFMAAKMLNIHIGLWAIALAMAIGGLLSAKKVAKTMSHKITAMNHGQGFTANLMTAILVTVASKIGVPVSTTHVSCGSLFGIGIINGTAHIKTILVILLAWLTTLPLAAAISMGVYLIYQ